MVRALKAQVGRIKRESGGQAKHHIPISFLGMRAAVPQVSPWVPNILTDIASSSPQVVEAFLNPERQLDNRRHTDSASAKVQEELDKRREAGKAGDVFAAYPKGKGFVGIGRVASKAKWSGPQANHVLLANPQHQIVAVRS